MRKKWLRNLLILIAILVLLVLVVSQWSRPAAAHPFYTNFKRWPFVIAHQGGDGLWPGDTLFAMQNSAQLPIDVLEMDIHSTKDGVLVLMHDETVDRTTNGSGLIKEKTISELRGLDAGYDWSPDDGASFPYRNKGITVSTLEEVFETIPNLPMNIEIKQIDPPIYNQFCQLIRKYARENKVLVASFDDLTIQSFRQSCPEVATSTAEGETRQFVIMNLAFLGRFFRPPANAVQVPEERSGINILTKRFVKTAQARGLKVDAWTINEVEEMHRVVDLGVDGIITDYPDRLLELLGR